MEQSTQNLEKVIKINESAIRDHLGEMVRSTVEETLNQMLDAEADKMCNAEKYPFCSITVLGSYYNSTF